MLDTLDTRYRKLVIALAPVISAGVLVLLDALDTGKPLTGGTPWAAAAVAVLTAAGVYFPASPLAKFAAAFAGTAGTVVVAALTDDHVSQAEGLQILLAILTTIGVGAIPNHPEPGNPELPSVAGDDLPPGQD